MTSAPSKLLTVNGYHVQASVDNNASFPFHETVSATWNLRWKFLAQRGLYPFTDGNGADFEEIFERLIADSKDDAAVFADPDNYAAPFFPVAEKLYEQGNAAEQSGDLDAARDFFLRCAAVYRIARFPINRSPATHKAWERGLDAYLRVSPLLDPPNLPVEIKHSHALASAGESTSDVIHAFVRIPKGEQPAGGWPVVLFICGLDAYRTDHSAYPGGKLQCHLEAGRALVVVDIPGTADSPAAREDPESPDRLWSSVLDWITSQDHGYAFDASRVAAIGISTGGYYAMRIAHTHADRLVGVVAQGGGSHHMFEPEWIRAMNHMEYPFALSNAIAYKFGFDDVDKFIASEPQKRFSLLETGILDRPSTRLLLINGMEDSIFPIEDSMLLLTRGSVKEARFIPGRGHMGFPEGQDFIAEWMTKLMIDAARK